MAKHYIVFRNPAPAGKAPEQGKFQKAMGPYTSKSVAVNEANALKVKPGIQVTVEPSPSEVIRRARPPTRRTKTKQKRRTAAPGPRTGPTMSTKGARMSNPKGKITAKLISWPNSKVFGGRSYVLKGRHRMKKPAQKDAEKWRVAGAFARVVKMGNDGYAVYMASKTRKNPAKPKAKKKAFKFPVTKMFNDIGYGLGTGHKTKKAAEKKKGEFKAKGYLVRQVKAPKGTAKSAPKYALYIRKAPKKGKTIRVSRKAYTTKAGVKVKASSFTVKDRGTPGRRTRGSKKGPFRKEKAWVSEDREGKLGGDGYTEKSARTRHGLLNKAVKDYGYRSTLGSLQVLLRNTEMSAKKRKVVEADKEWLKDKYGGPGSFGPKKKAKRKNPATPAAPAYHYVSKHGQEWRVYQVKKLASGKWTGRLKPNTGLPWRTSGGKVVRYGPFDTLAAAKRAFGFTGSWKKGAFKKSDYPRGRSPAAKKNPRTTKRKKNPSTKPKWTSADAGTAGRVYQLQAPDIDMVFTLYKMKSKNRGEPPTPGWEVRLYGISRTTATMWLARGGGTTRIWNGARRFKTLASAKRAAEAFAKKGVRPNPRTTKRKGKQHKGPKTHFHPTHKRTAAIITNPKKKRKKAGSVYVARYQTARGITHRVVSEKKAAAIMASPTGKPGPGGALALWRSTPAYQKAGESVWRAKSGYLPLVWEYGAGRRNPKGKTRSKRAAGRTGNPAVVEYAVGVGRRPKRKR